ncbi:YgiQ family radical SAM protein [candidate division WOR-3 bacterium]|nr:YgiQ family radical SAM protein [candidate division WOR-3 bacterium]
MTLPSSREEILWTYKTGYDVLLLTGDAYVDHPSFGVSLIARLLQHHGYKTAVCSQPTKETLKKIPKPDLFVGITAGNLDSIVSNYTGNRKIRNDDKFSSFGRAFRNDGTKRRPDRASIVYSNWAKELYKNTPIVLGGVESSLRRIAHYDYFSDNIRKSAIADSKADFLVFGMGETQILEIAERIRSNPENFDKKGIPGTCYLSGEPDGLEIPSFENVKNDPAAFLESQIAVNANSHPVFGKLFSQKQDTRYVVCNPPAMPVKSAFLDLVYSLPYSRKAHVSSRRVPALEMIANSITSHRGCAGSCSFCSIKLHQGKTIVSRSEDSIMDELDAITRNTFFRGHITDVGGPSADMYGSYCSKYPGSGCNDRECLYPEKCPFFKTDPEKYLGLLDKIASKKGVKKVSIGSGLRLDIILVEDRYLKKILLNYTSGILKVAPEHISPSVLKIIRKYRPHEFEDFIQRFHAAKVQFGSRVELVPYFILSHPGEGEKEFKELLDFSKKSMVFNRSFQDFTPTPMTDSTCAYYTGIDAATKKPVVTVKKQSERHKRRENFAGGASKKFHEL